MAVGGPFADNLRRLYDYLDRRLMESNLKKEDGGIREVIQHLAVLRDAWSALLQGQGSVPAQVLDERLAA